MRSRILRSLRVTLLLLSIALPAGAFSSGSPVCTADAAQMIAGHGPTFGVSGTYTLQVRRAGTPTTTVVPGETVQVVIANGQGLTTKGFTLRAQLGSTSGSGVGGLTPGSGQQPMVGCSPTSSGVTHTSSVAVANPRSVNWTVPSGLPSGQSVVFSALILESANSTWATIGPVSVAVSAPTPVPGLGLVSLVTAGVGLFGFAAWRMRRS